MKTQLIKIIIGAAALLFAISGVAFADDRDYRHHKPHKKAYGLYKAKKHLPYRNHKHFKRWRHHRDRYIRKEIHHHHHYYGNHQRRWKKNHFKFRRPHRDRYIYKEVYHRHENHHRRRAPRQDLIYKVALKDPGIVFKVILKEPGLFW